MLALGLDGQLIRLIMKCVRTVSYSFVLNGNRMGKIIPSRGLKQGDPLSPYLFLLCAEGLSRMLSWLEVENRICRLKISRLSPSISHLFFADDCFLFFRAKEAEAGMIARCLKAYSMLTGQKVNYGKSGLCVSPNVDEYLKQSMASVLGVRLVTFHDRYLGLPAVFPGRKAMSLKFVKDRMWVYIHKWKHSFFSAGGKEVLIKAVLQAVPTYVMSCFQLPVSLVKECNRVLARFWWGGEEEGRKVHWASWKKLCVPKGRGGLGFRDLQLFNKALLAKQGWKLVEYPNSLLCRVLKGKYFRDCSFMETKHKGNESFVWRSLMWRRSLLKEGLRWRIGDGNLVNVIREVDS